MGKSGKRLEKISIIFHGPPSAVDTPARSLAQGGTRPGNKVPRILWLLGVTVALLQNDHGHHGSLLLIWLKSTCSHRNPDPNLPKQLHAAKCSRQRCKKLFMLSDLEAFVTWSPIPIPFITVFWYLHITYIIFIKWNPVLHCTCPSVFRWSMRWNSKPEKTSPWFTMTLCSNSVTFISKGHTAAGSKSNDTWCVWMCMEQIYWSQYMEHMIQDLQDLTRLSYVSSKHLSVSLLTSSIQLSASLLSVAHLELSCLSCHSCLCQRQFNACTWCTPPISCHMVQNVRSRNFHGYSCLVLCNGSIKCLQSMKRKAIFIHQARLPSKRPKWTCIRRPWRVGAVALDVAILARQVAPVTLAVPIPKHRLQLQLASEALLHDGPDGFRA